MQNFQALGALPPDPRAPGGWGLCSQTPSLRRQGALPPDPHWPPVAGGYACRPVKQPPIANFWLRACVYLLMAHPVLLVFLSFIKLGLLQKHNKHRMAQRRTFLENIKEADSSVIYLVKGYSFFA